MKTMIFVSLAALMPTTRLEYKAMSQAMASLGQALPWSLDDHVAMSRKATMLETIEAMSRLHNVEQIREAFFVHFHELLDGYFSDPYPDILKLLGTARKAGMRTILLSDYPLQTTNLARAAALHAHATGVGEVFTPREADQPLSMEARLASLIQNEAIFGQACTAVVSRLRHARAATNLGLEFQRTKADLTSIMDIAPISTSSKPRSCPSGSGFVAAPDYCQQKITAHSRAA